MPLAWNVDRLLRSLSSVVDALESMLLPIDLVDTLDGTIALLYMLLFDADRQLLVGCFSLIDYLRSAPSDPILGPLGPNFSSSS
jgi:hypothetical protein